MTYPSNRLVALGVLGAALFAVPALAEERVPQAAAPGHASEKTPGRPKEHVADQAGKGEARDEKAGGKPDKQAEKVERAEAKAEKAAARADKAEERREFRSALRDLREDLKSGKVSKVELKDRLSKLKETLPDRRRAHREAIKERWGATLADPQAKSELELYARRLAKLNRALFVAESERQGKDKEALVDRIEKLIQKENERHEKAMERLKSGSAAVKAQGDTLKAGANPAADPATARALLTGTAAPTPAEATPAPLLTNAAPAKGATP
jgi:hypothetical protein